MPLAKPHIILNLLIFFAIAGACPLAFANQKVDLKNLKSKDRALRLEAIANLGHTPLTKESEQALRALLKHAEKLELFYASRRLDSSKTIARQAKEMTESVGLEQAEMRQCVEAISRLASHRADIIEKLIKEYHKRKTANPYDVNIPAAKILAAVMRLNLNLAFSLARHESAYLQALAFDFMMVLLKKNPQMTPALRTQLLGEALSAYWRLLERGETLPSWLWIDTQIDAIELIFILLDSNSRETRTYAQKVVMPLLKKAAEGVMNRYPQMEWSDESTSTLTAIAEHMSSLRPVRGMEPLVKKEILWILDFARRLPKGLFYLEPLFALAAGNDVDTDHLAHAEQNIDRLIEEGRTPGAIDYHMVARELEKLQPDDTIRLLELLAKNLETKQMAVILHELRDLKADATLDLARQLSACQDAFRLF